MATTIEVGKAFWNKKPARGSSVHSTGDKLFSYGTVILQRLQNGKVIGNATKYSVTTSKHQSQVNIFKSDYRVTGVPMGRSDLRPYKK